MAWRAVCQVFKWFDTPKKVITNPFTSPVNEANCRQATFSLHEICIFLAWCLIFFAPLLSLFLPFSRLILTALITDLSSFLDAICHRLCGQTGAITRRTLLGIALWGALMKVSGPLHTRGCFHRALTHLIHSSLLLSPQTGLLEGSVTAPCLTLSYQVNLSCGHWGSSLDANKLRHYEMNENFLL